MATAPPIGCIRVGPMVPIIRSRPVVQHADRERAPNRSGSTADAPVRARAQHGTRVIRHPPPRLLELGCRRGLEHPLDEGPRGGVGPLVDMTGARPRRVDGTEEDPRPLDVAGRDRARGQALERVADALLVAELHRELEVAREEFGLGSPSASRAHPAFVSSIISTKWSPMRTASAMTSSNMGSASAGSAAEELDAAELADGTGR